VFLVGAVIAAASEVAFALVADGPLLALPLRFLTGVAIAAVYPVAVKIIVGWFRAERGLAVGVLIGALTLGSAAPHLFQALGASSGADWRTVVLAGAVAALVGGLVVVLGTRDGPFDMPAPRFSTDVALRAFREPSVRLANLGYLGHMWELFAMWTWVPLFLAASFGAWGERDAATASLAAFGVIGIGAVGCVGAGLLADRLGRTRVTIGAMALSGATALAIGWTYGAHPALVLALAVVWGITVIADSAQFSAAVSELSPPGTAGSALSVQVASGFILTSITIVGIGLVDPGDGTGWRVAFTLLALGPAVGIVAMWRLRGRPDAVRMAGGRR
jgi:MFS family permease